MAIDSFTGDYHFLSNFAASKVELDGVEYKSVEHGYQAAKTLNRSNSIVIYYFNADDHI